MTHRKLHLTRLLIATAIMGVAAADTAAQTTQAQAPTTSATVLSACYVPATGTVYLTGEAGTPGQCANPAHIAFSWNTEGPQGPQGPIGPTGETGPEGPKGIDGADGAAMAGTQGPAGELGPMGPTGPAGVPGVKGDTGVVGPQGVIGATGPAGVQGVQGDTGAAGAQGVAGGISGLEIVSGTHPYDASLINASLDCPAGKVAISGAYDLLVPFADPHGPRVVMSRRDPLNAQRWLWIVADDMNFSPHFEIEVTCVIGS